jgi:hypothetical protein
MGFGASSKEAMAEVADFSLELRDLLLESVFALSGALVHGLVVVGLLSEGDGFEAVRAGWVGAVTKCRKQVGKGGEVGRSGIVPGRGRQTERRNAIHTGSMTRAQLQSQVSSDGFTDSLPMQSIKPLHQRDLRLGFVAWDPASLVTLV